MIHRRGCRKDGARGWTGGVVALAMVLVTAATGLGVALPVGLAPSDDAYLDHGQPTTNFDQARMLLTDSRAIYGSEDSRYVVLRFDLAGGLPAASPDNLGIPGPDDDVRVVLNVYIQNAGCAPGPACSYDPAGGRYAVYALTDDDWTEEEVTFRTAPASGGLAAAQAYAGSDRWYGFDVTDAVTASVEAADTVVGFKLRIEHPGVLKYNFVPSKESDLGPHLAIATGPGV